jgi:hypothetical protein
MAIIELARKGRTCRIGSSVAALRVYAVDDKHEVVHKKTRFQVALRVSSAAMRKLKWIAGDRVTALFDDENRTWTLTRVSDRNGNALSGKGKKTGTATVRFSVTRDQLSAFGLREGEGYDADLVSDEGDAGVFAVK